MDDFDNFFDDQRSPEPEKTPIYHTPEPKHKNKKNLTVILCIILAVLMCVLVVVNVIVLSTLKTSIAAEYAQTMEAKMREIYEQAVNDALAGTDVIKDVTDSATNKVIDALDTTIGEIADNYASSVARLYMFESENASINTGNLAGVATGFLISDTNDDGTLQRYIVTNAHCVRYAKSVAVGSIGGWWGGTTYRYEWASYGKIIAKFENNSTAYTTEIVAYGAYNDNEKGLNAENDQADLAILRIIGTQPANYVDGEGHKSLKLATSDTGITRGTPVALIGNPEGIGDSNSITSGTISQTGISIASWGPGTFIMTDAAVNGGNSGGPMIDRRGVVLGVVESKLVSDDIDNMGFALSARTLHDFIIWAQKAANNTLHKDIEINCVYVAN